MGWHKTENAVDMMSTYCAPTVLSKLLDVDKKEASRILLSIQGMPSKAFGSVRRSQWHGFLRMIGGVPVDTDRPDGQDRWKRAVEQYFDRNDEYDAGYRIRPPRLSWRDAYNYTVAQWRKKYDEGIYVLSVLGHTLLVEDGVVTADTRPSKSSRARVVMATRFDRKPTLEEALAYVD